MKQYFLYSLIILCAIASCQNGNASSSSSQQSVENSINESSDFYKRLEGTIAGQPIIMHLHQIGNSYDGMYYYVKRGSWITLRTDSIAGNNIIFSESIIGDNWMADETMAATLHCTLEKESITGTWVSSDKSKSYSIALKESYPQGTYRFDIAQYGDSMKAFQGENSPVAAIDNSFVEPKNNEWLTQELKTILGSDNSLGFQEGFSKKAKEYFANYKSEIAGETDTTASYLNYAQSQNVYVRYNDHGFVVLESFVYEYSGGAHGNYGSSMYCFDVINKKQLKLSDILTTDSAALVPVLEKNFRKQYHITEAKLNGVLFEEHLAANDNFYFTENGIGFIYNPYEVASYAQGQINVFIPFGDFKNYLNADFKARIN